jgi:hypothetical protein
MQILLLFFTFFTFSIDRCTYRNNRFGHLAVEWATKLVVKHVQQNRAEQRNCAKPRQNAIRRVNAIRTV